eukprot:TRINITY_DN2141_c0_g1_i1.p1 TRINITY_DN2141_c0_g1~~TRINITY_DN2141_c0_g1_i1.p1  ORF type:complete len:308 (+),score=63.67 TRINITY_DN2141_c0_g1_i1:454-1377(+)
MGKKTEWLKHRVLRHVTRMSVVEAWVWLTIQMASEVFTATVVVLLYRDDRRPAWIVFTVFTPVRVIFWLAFSVRLNWCSLCLVWSSFYCFVLFCSAVLSRCQSVGWGVSGVLVLGGVHCSCSFRRRFWRKWITIDMLLVTGVGSVVAYVFMCNEISGDEGWRIAAMVSFCVLIPSLSGVFRCIMAFYPFGYWSMLAYKIVRCYHALFYCINEIVQHVIETRGEGGEAEGEKESADTTEKLVSALQLFYVLTTLHYVYHLLEETLERQKEVRHELIEEGKRNKEETENKDKVEPDIEEGKVYSNERSL